MSLTFGIPQELDIVGPLTIQGNLVTATGGRAQIGSGSNSTLMVSDSGNFVGVSVILGTSGVLSNQIINTGSLLYQYMTGLSGFDITNLATITQLQFTGSSLYADIIGLSGNLTGTYASNAQLNGLSGYALTTFSAVRVSGSALVTGANFTGIGGTLVFWSGNFICISGAGGGTSLQVTGSPTIVNATLTGIGGTQVFVSGNTIFISGGAGGGGITTGGGLLNFAFQLSTGLPVGNENPFISFPSPGFSSPPFVIYSLANNSGNAILASQLSGVTSAGFNLSLSAAPTTSNYFLSYMATTGTGIQYLGGSSSAGGGGSSTITVSGSSVIPIANFTGIGGAIVFVSGTTIFISGGAGGGGSYDPLGTAANTGQALYQDLTGASGAFNQTLSVASGILYQEITGASSLLYQELTGASGLFSSITVTGSAILNNPVFTGYDHIAVKIVGNNIISISGGTGLALTANLGATGQALLNDIIGLSGLITTSATVANLALTGSGLYTLITGMSGQDVLNYASNANLTQSGVIIESQISSLSGFGTGFSGVLQAGINAAGGAGAAANTGQMLYQLVTGFSGVFSSSSAIIETQIIALSGFDIGISGALQTSINSIVGGSGAANTGQMLYQITTGLSGAFLNPNQYNLAGGTGLLLNTYYYDNFGPNRTVGFVGLPTNGSFVSLLTNVTGQCTLQFPTSNRIGQAGAVTGLILNLGSQSISWIYANTNWWLTDSTSLTNNINSARNPINTDDTTSGYAPGSLWINQSTELPFVCISSQAGAAFWFNLSSSGVTFSVTGSNVINEGTLLVSGLGNTVVFLSGQNMYISGISAAGSFDALGTAAATGQVLYPLITGLSGQAVATYATNTNLNTTNTNLTIETGVRALQDKLLSGFLAPASGNYLYTTGIQNITSQKTFSDLLVISSGLATPFHSVGGSNYTVSSGDFIVIFTGFNNAGITGILPPAGQFTGQFITIINTSLGPLQISGLVGGDTNPIISQFDSLEIYSCYSSSLGQPFWQYIRQTGNTTTPSSLALTGQQAWAAANNNGINISGNLTISGQTLYTYIIGVSGLGNATYASSFSLLTTGQTLYNDTTGLSGVMNTEINALSGYIQSGQNRTLVLTGAGGSVNVNWSSGNAFYLSLVTGTTLSFSNTGDGQTIVITVFNSTGTNGVNNSTGWSLTWPASVKWAPTGFAPIMSTGSHYDIYTLMYNAPVGAVFGAYIQNY